MPQVSYEGNIGKFEAFIVCMYDCGVGWGMDQAETVFLHILASRF